MDPPDHTRIRKLVSAAFTPKRMATLEPVVHLVADELLDELDPMDSVDLIGGYAVPLPLRVIAHLLGVPTTDIDTFQTATATLVDTAGKAALESRDAARCIYSILTELIAAKRNEPGSDLISALIAARDGSDQLSEDELLSLAFLILWAGYENSVHLIGNSILTLLQRPALADPIRQEGVISDEVTNELIRHCDGNDFAIRRFPTEDISISGQVIPAGSTVLLNIRDANRDPRKFAQPDIFEPTRAARSHLSFGHGIHYCIGAPLARLELTVAVIALLRRYPGFKLATPVTNLTRRESIRIHALATLPVQLSPTADRVQGRFGRSSVERAQ
jgi:cytochrome P450